MTGLLLVSMANRLTENALHEIIGILMLAFFILHQALNWRLYQSLFKGRYETRRMINAVANVLLVSVFAILMGSSVMISKTLFSFLGIEGSLTLRQLHTTMAYWLLALSGVHLGVHWPRLVRMIIKTMPVFRNIRPPKIFKWLMTLMIVIAGILASFDRNLGAKLFMTYTFDFWDFDQSVLGFFFRNLSMIGLFALRETLKSTENRLQATWTSTWPRQIRKRRMNGLIDLPMIWLR